jgi:hypothetical protein
VKLDTDAAQKLTEAEMGRYSKEMRPAVLATANGLPNLYEMKRLVDGPMASGPFMDTRQFGGRLADWLGVSPMSEPMLARNEFINRAAKNTIALLQTRALGSGSGVSEGDRKFMEGMTQKSGDYTLQELKDLNRIAIKESQRSLDQHADEVGRLRQLPGVSRLPESYFKVQVPSYDDWAKNNPAAAAPSIPPPPAGFTPLNGGANSAVPPPPSGFRPIR